ncbi:VanZ family protein [Lentzea sp. NPDC042327]|uniref:VanZ family protein n=1 Tax=Lentzea sp. NPDC042327 TaxID=3154801 RepID=UPI0033D561C3
MDVFDPVPVLPVVVPLAAVAFLALLWVLHRRGRLTVPRAGVALALCVYVAGVVANTVFPIYLSAPATEARWKVYFGLVDGYDVGDAVTNILVFMPVGMIVPLLLATPSWWRVLVASTAFSAVIELSQFFTGNLWGGGHLADVNDLLFNVVGGVLGYGVFSLLTRVPALAAFIDLFRWSDPRPVVSSSSR